MLFGRRKIWGILAITFLLGMFVSALNVPCVKAAGTIYIRADGSIDPPDALISTLDNVTYTVTGSITSDGDGVVVERDNIVIDGAGQTLQGSGNGINLTEKMNVTIKGAKIRGFASGIYLNNASFCSIYGNNITNNDAGVYLEYSSVNSISENNITNNNHGIWLYSSSNYNSISGNNVAANSGEGIKLENCLYTSIVNNDISDNDLAGIWLFFSNSSLVSQNRITRTHYAGIMLDISSSNTILENDVRDNRANIVFEYSINGGVALSSDNRIFRNNFINGTWNVVTYFAGQPENFWDDGYPSGGNYWSDYSGTDANQDGIGDTEHILDVNNADHYPLMGMFSEFDWVSLAAPEQRIQTICNSTISNLVYNGTAIKFNVTGADGTAGFCRIRIPTVLLNITYKVFVNGTEVTNRLLPFSNETYCYLYFNYTHSTQEVIVIPESPSFLILSLFSIATLLAVIIYRRQHRGYSINRRKKGIVLATSPLRARPSPRRKQEKSGLGKPSYCLHKLP